MYASRFSMSLPWCATPHSIRNRAPVLGSVYVLSSLPIQTLDDGENVGEGDDGDNGDVFSGGGALLTVVAGWERIVSVGDGGSWVTNTVIILAGSGSTPTRPPVAVVVAVVVVDTWLDEDDVVVLGRVTKAVVEWPSTWRDSVSVTMTGGVERELLLTCPLIDVDSEVELRDRNVVSAISPHYLLFDDDLLRALLLRHAHGNADDDANKGNNCYYDKNLKLFLL